MSAKIRNNNLPLGDSGSTPSSKRSSSSRANSTHGSSLFTVLRRPRTYSQRLRFRVVLAVFAAVAAVVLTVTALRTPWGQAVDTLAMESLMRWADPLNRITEVATNIVSGVLLAAMAGAIGITAVLRRRLTLSGRALGMIGAANLTTQLLKWTLDRADFGITTGVPNSLPSGHVTVIASLLVGLIIVAPEWLRGPSAWLAWGLSSVMSVVVMVEGWHRLSDVCVAMLIVGFWALVLTPLETRQRHGELFQDIMTASVLLLFIIAVIVTAIGIFGVNFWQVAQPGSGFGFHAFLEGEPVRARVLSVAALAWIIAVSGAVVNSVDRLSAGS